MKVVFSIIAVAAGLCTVSAARGDGLTPSEVTKSLAGQFGWSCNGYGNPSNGFYIPNVYSSTVSVPVTDSIQNYFGAEISARSKVLAECEQAGDLQCRVIQCSGSHGEKTDLK